MKMFLVLLVSSLPVIGQFAQFVTTDDGRQTYFVSSLQYREVANPLARMRAYRIAENGPEPFGDRDGVQHVVVSGDGLTVGVGFGTGSELKGLRTATFGLGNLLLSRNGRWALLNLSQVGFPVFRAASAKLTDLESGEETVLPAEFAGRGYVASDGTVVMEGPGGRILWRRGVVTPIVTKGPIFGISDNARYLVYRSLFDLPAAITVRDLVTGKETVVPSDDFLGMSNDGGTLLNRVGTSAFAFRILSGEMIRLPVALGDAVTSGTLNGDGTVTILSTSRGRIVRVALASPNVLETLVEETPYLMTNGVFVAGSRYRLSGGLFGGSVFVGDLRLPVIGVDAATTDVQIPWELSQPGIYPLRVENASGSPFRQTQTVQLGAFLPQFELRGPGVAGVLPYLAVKGDFSGLLTANPKPGETIILYGRGFGVTNGTVPTGYSTPADRLFPIAGSIRCIFYPYAEYAETSFVGLAPLLIGVYQINFRLPAGPDLGRITGGYCSWSSLLVEGGFSWMVQQ